MSRNKFPSGLVLDQCRSRSEGVPAGPGSDPGPVQACAVYLWFLQDSWCTPPLWFSGRQHRWLRLDRDRADSQLTSRGWRHHRNHLYNAHSSNQMCCPDSHKHLERQTAVSQPPVPPVPPVREQLPHSVTCVRVAGVAVAVTVAGLTGAESSELWTGTSISHSALLTVLTLVTLRTGALLHPAGWNTRTPPRRHQGDIVKVTCTWTATMST